MPEKNTSHKNTIKQTPKKACASELECCPGIPYFFLQFSHSFCTETNSYGISEYFSLYFIRNIKILEFIDLVVSEITNLLFWNNNISDVHNKTKLIFLVGMSNQKSD